MQDSDDKQRRATDQQAQRRFAEFVVDHMGDAVYWIRRDGSFVHVHQAACRMLGHTREELLSKTMFDINPQMDRERWPRMWQALMEQGSRAFESVHATRDGRTLTVAMEVHVFELDGEKYSCAIARTSRASVRSRRNASESTASWRGSSAVVYADNRRAREVLGWSPRYGLQEIIATAWQWHQKHPDGFA